MAQRLTYWGMKGKYDVEIKHVILKSKADIALLMANLPIGTDVVTIDRTDRQSNIMHEIWHSPRYRDLNER